MDENDIGKPKSGSPDHSFAEGFVNEYAIGIIA